MPPNLRKAHRNLDLAVDKLYRSSAFESDRERVEHLFELSEKIVAPLTAVTTPHQTTFMIRILTRPIVGES